MRSASGGLGVGGIVHDWVEGLWGAPKDLNLCMGARIPVLVLVLDGNDGMHRTQSHEDPTYVFKSWYCSTGHRVQRGIDTAPFNMQWVACNY
jgi:hypothetical protein